MPKIHKQYKNKGEIKFQVCCEKCGKGNLCLPNGYDSLADYYTVHCTHCDNMFTTHYTGMDNILEAHQYNSSMNDDIKVLNANGSWAWRNGSRFKGDNFNLETYAKDMKHMKHIQTIDAYETHRYYQSGSNFVQVVYNSVHDEYEIYDYVAKDGDGVSVLVNHFFKVIV